MRNIGPSDTVKRYIQAFHDVEEVLTVKELAERLNVSEWAVYRGIKALVHSGYVSEVRQQNPHRRGRPIKKYALTDKGKRLKRALGGDVDIVGLKLVLQPAFKQLESGNLVRSIAVLERFLNDSRRSIAERKVALYLWVFFFMTHGKDMFPLDYVEEMVKDITTLLSDTSISPFVKARSFIAVVWILLPYITVKRKLVMVPDEVLFSDEEIIGYISLHWHQIEDFINNPLVEKK